MKTIYQNAEYKAATEQLTQLMEAHGAALAEEQALLSRLIAKPEGSQSALERAKALLTGQAAPVRNDIAGLQARHAECMGKLALLGQAIGEQRDILARLVSAQSATANAERKADHIKAVERIKPALAGLRAALEAEQAIRAEIGAAGYSCTLEPIESYALNFLDPDSYVGRFERDVSAYLLRCEIQSKKTVNVHLLTDHHTYGRCGDVVTLPGSVAADLVNQGQAELTTDKPGRKPLAQVISEVIYS